MLRQGRFVIRSEYRTIEEWDDFILLANKILDDDLFVVVNARRASVSHSSDLDSLPEFLQRYFSRNNLIVLYPEQFGEQAEEMAMTDTMTADIVSAPSPLWLKLTSYYRRGIQLRKRFTQRNRQNKIDL